MSLRNLLKHRPTDYILVAGAAHIDVLADYSSTNPAMDKIGQVRYSIGGTGYNIAINLAQSGVPVRFVTVLKNNSFSSVWIRERLEAAGVRSDLVQLSDRIPESGFVGLRSDGTLETAVTSTAVGEYIFQAQMVEEAVANARMVVVDCNIAEDQMSLFIESAKRHSRPVAIPAVSDSKVMRLMELEDHQPIDLVMLNRHELEVAAGGKSDDPLKAACQILRAKHAIVTCGADGYDVVAKSGRVKHYKAPQIEKVVSTSGAGDALLAGVLAYWYKNQSLDFDEAVPTVATSVRKVLQQPGATVGSVANEIDFALLARIAIRNEPLWKRILSPEIGVAVTILVLILTAALVWLTYELLPPKPSGEAGSPAVHSEASGAKSTTPPEPSK